MKYIIMADGKGTRWNNYKNIPKHLIEVNGENLLARMVRLIHEFDESSEVIITSHDERYEVAGATRYEPQNNILEIDRFTKELIEDDVCFLYGDTYYSEDAIKTIISNITEDLLFFGNEKSIVAIKVKNSNIFKKHIERVTELYLSKKIKDCKGWQVYQSFTNMPFDEKQMGVKYIYLSDNTQDFNTPEDYNKLENGKEV